MESTSHSSLEQALFLAAMGNHTAALTHLTEDTTGARVTATKATILLSLGKYQNAIETLEEDTTSAENVYVRLVLARALFLNGESERAAIETQKLKEQLDAATPSSASDEVEHRDLIQ